MKTTIIGMILIFGTLGFWGYRIINHISQYYEYKSKISCNWDLSERASTLEQKAEYMNKYVNAFDTNKLKGVNANYIVKTNESDFMENYKALQSLQKRLNDIAKMDENSLSYQTAIAQITAQEQGEGKEMIENLSLCWHKNNYYSYNNPFIVIGLFILYLILISIGFNIITND